MRICTDCFVSSWVNMLGGQRWQTQSSTQQLCHTFDSARLLTGMPANLYIFRSHAVGKWYPDTALKIQKKRAQLFVINFTPSNCFNLAYAYNMIVARFVGIFICNLPLLLASTFLLVSLIYVHYVDRGICLGRTSRRCAHTEIMEGCTLVREHVYAL